MAPAPYSTPAAPLTTSIRPAERVDLGRVLAAPLLALLPHAVLQDQHAVGVEPADDRLEIVGPVESVVTPLRPSSVWRKRLAPPLVQRPPFENLDGRTSRPSASCAASAVISTSPRAS